jgi:hypothetical protein
MRLLTTLFLPLDQSSVHNVRFFLYNSKNDTRVAQLTNGTNITNPPPCRKMNIEAVIRCDDAGDVKLELYRGHQLVKRKIEYVAPYFLFGNNGRHIHDGKISPGNYGIRVRVEEKWSPFTNFTMGGKCGES